MVRSSLIGIVVVFVVFWGAEPAVPQVPQAAGAPFVKSVSFYRDWRLTQPIDTAVEPGTTLYTKIVFSEPMRLKVAANNTARPVLYCQIGSNRIRYRIAKHGASGADFVSGDAKPLHGGTDDYICKYTVPEAATGKFTTMVGKLSADRSGKTMENFYTHATRLAIGSSDVTPAAGKGGGTPNITQPTIDEGDGDPNLTQPIRTAVEPETPMDPTDIIALVDTAPDEKPPRDEAFIFKKFIEQLISDLKAVYLHLEDADFQPPGKGVFGPAAVQLNIVRKPDTYVLGTFLPDPVTHASVSQVNKFSKEYKLTVAELKVLLRNLRNAKIRVIDPVEVNMPDKNLRKAVVAKIYEQAVLPPENREVPEEFLIWVGGPRKPSDPIYAPEMRLIGTLKAEAAGIESLTGLEYAINLKQLLLGNPIYWTWDVMFFSKDDLKHEYKTTKPETPNIISDLTPLSDLKKLQTLGLEYNAVSNLHPLASLENLQWLNLTENKITAISPLQNLTNLTFLTLRNDYYGPEWAGNNAVQDLSPLRDLNKLEGLYVDHNPIGGTVDIVRSLPKLNHLSASCCGVSDLRLFLEHPQLGQAGGTVYLVYSPLTVGDVPAIKTLEARGVRLDTGIYWIVEWGTEQEGPILKSVIVSKTFKSNQVELCSVSYRESRRAAPALYPQLGTEPAVLSSLWHDLSEVPEETALLPNYPNPFNPETWIPYQLATPAEVTVAIYAADGRLVRTFAVGDQAAGVYQSKGRAVFWDGRNAHGEPVASGVYFYTLMTGDFTATRKLLIRK